MHAAGVVHPGRHALDLRYRATYKIGLRSLFCFSLAVVSQARP
jgi:hypothetical protein